MRAKKKGDVNHQDLFPKGDWCSDPEQKTKNCRMSGKGSGPFLHLWQFIEEPKAKAMGSALSFAQWVPFPLWCPSEAAGSDCRKKGLSCHLVRFYTLLSFGSKILGARD